jgi:hypothetical protein
LEREVADDYRDWSLRTKFEFPYTAKLLAEIADMFERDAKWHDNDAEMMQW